MRFYHWFWWHIYLLLLLLLLAIILFWFLFWLDYMRAYSSSQNSIVLVTRLRYYSGWFSHWIALLCFLTCTQNERNETRKKQVAKAYTTWLSSSCRTALYHDVARLLLLVCRLIACRFTLMWFNRLGLVFSSENVLAIAYLIKRNFKWNNAQQVMLFTFFSLQLSQLTEYQITQTPSPQFGLTPSLSLSFLHSVFHSFFFLRCVSSFVCIISNSVVVRLWKFRYIRSRDKSISWSTSIKPSALHMSTVRNAPVLHPQPNHFCLVFMLPTQYLNITQIYRIYVEFDERHTRNSIAILRIGYLLSARFQCELICVVVVAVVIIIVVVDVVWSHFYSQRARSRSFYIECIPIIKAHPIWIHVKICLGFGWLFSLLSICFEKIP